MHVSGALHERYAPRSVHPVHPMAHHHHIYPEPAFVDTDSVLHVSGVAGARVAHSADDVTGTLKFPLHSEHGQPAAIESMQQDNTLLGGSGPGGKRRRRRQQIVANLRGRESRLIFWW